MRFDELDLEDEILDGLDDMNFQEMTPVQEHTIPVILEGRDIIGCAQTGTGKTAAYTLPLLNRLLIEGNEDNVIKSVRKALPDQVGADLLHYLAGNTVNNTAFSLMVQKHSFWNSCSHLNIFLRRFQEIDNLCR